MKGDFSRFTFDPAKHFSAVRLQQGRVQLDADWNEQIDITAHRIETEIMDFIGQAGAPAQGAGFAIQAASAGASLTLSRGRYYVEGMLFELDADVAFAAQPDFPGAVLPSADGSYLAYLDAWQHHLSGREDPRLLDPALGDADTATRLRNVAQVKLQLLTDKDSKNPRDYLPPWRPPWDLPISSGALAARVSAPRPLLENQLYRVEIHQGGGTGTATFKWSRDNGSVAARVKGIAGQTITLRAGGRGAQTDFAANQWVEVITQAQALRGEPGVLAEIAAVQGDELTVSRWPNDAPPAIDASAVVRRWDSSPGEIAVKAGPTALEDDIEVIFDPSAAARYKTGDYWLIAARNLSAAVEWPQNADQSPSSVPPHGVLHRYCALALLTLKNGKWSVDADLRVLFRPIASGLVNKAGDTMTGPLNVLGNVGIGTTAPQARLHVQADAAAQGTGTTGGTPPLCQLADGKGVSQFQVSPTGDVEVRASVFVNSVVVNNENKRLSVAGANEDLRIVRGNVIAAGVGRAGRGFSARKAEDKNAIVPGLYDVFFAPAFSGIPSASVTIVHQEKFEDVSGLQLGLPTPEFDNIKGSPKENALIIFLSADKMRVKTGDENGNPKPNNFSFIVVGPR